MVKDVKSLLLRRNTLKKEATKRQDQLETMLIGVGRKPIRPFQNPPHMIDMTDDNQYELKWAPIKESVPGKRRDIDEQNEKKYDFRFDRR